MKYRSGQFVPTAIENAPCAVCGRPMPEDRFVLPSHKHGYRFVPSSDVTMLRASMKWTELWTRAGEQGVIPDPICRLVARFPRFLRIHRAILVDPQSVTCIRPPNRRCSSGKAFVAGVPGSLPISRREWNHVKEWLTITPGSP